MGTEEVKPLEQRAYTKDRTKGGNVRPADDRFLSSSQKRRRDAHVTKVEEATAEAEVRDTPDEDPIGDALDQAVQPVAEPVALGPSESKEDDA